MKKSLTYKELKEIVDKTDCGAETCFRSSQGEYHLLGWARRLIETAFQAGKENCSKPHFAPDWKPSAEMVVEAMNEGLAVGREEVVKWVESNSRRWEAQLLVWGLNPTKVKREWYLSELPSAYTYEQSRPALASLGQ